MIEIPEDDAYAGDTLHDPQLSNRYPNQWDLDRYVLGDSCLDRDAFEDKLAQDDRLALALARTVGELGQLTNACRDIECREARPLEALPIKKTAAVRVSHRGSRHRRIWAAVSLVAAASLVVSLAVNSGRQPTNQMVDDASLLSAVAERWLVFDDVQETDDDMQDLGLVEDITSGTESSLFTDGAAEESDWIVEAGQEYYRELES